jgi:hypothetical protein
MSNWKLDTFLFQNTLPLEFLARLPLELDKYLVCGRYQTNYGLETHQ